jgi:hypothetical protein
MKAPRITDVEGAILIAAAILVALIREALRNSNDGGFPLFSTATLISLWPVLAVAVVVVILMAIRPSK